MLRLLLSSGLLFQGIKEDLSARASRAAASLVFIVCALVFFHCALIAFAVAAAVWLIPHLGVAGAVALVGLAALVIGIILVLLARREPRPRHAASPVAPAAAVGGISLLSEVDKVIRAAPVPVMIGAVVLGLMLGNHQAKRDD